jgi:hypothetical protein
MYSGTYFIVLFSLYSYKRAKFTDLRSVTNASVLGELFTNKSAPALSVIITADAVISIRLHV